MTEQSSPLPRVLSLFQTGNSQGLLALFAGEPRLNSPLTGELGGRWALLAAAAMAPRWLAAHEVKTTAVALTSAGGRTVYELVAHLMWHGKPVDLPVAVVADLEDGKLGFTRVYHSLWPLRGKHEVRPPVLPHCEEPALPDTIGRYLDALASGDVEGILALFAPEGYVREPSGGQYHYQGAARRREFYGAILKDGGIPLQHCTVTDDGVRCAVEYNAVRWGGHELPPQAGVAVYERAPSGLLTAARIYDDVEPPQ